MKWLFANLILKMENKVRVRYKGKKGKLYPTPVDRVHTWEGGQDTTC